MKYILLGMLISGTALAEIETVWVCDQNGNCQYVTVYR